jgi:hypothetical protein
LAIKHKGRNMKNFIILFILIASISNAQRPADEKLTNYVSAILVNDALDKAAAAVGGSGVANQLTYWVGTTTIGALSTTTYPSLTELARIKGVTSPIQTQLGTKQATLVSGTNIKTINSQSLLGSGNIVIVSDTTGLWLKVNNIVKSLIVGDVIIGTSATLDSVIVDFRKNNYLRLNK